MKCLTIFIILFLHFSAVSVSKTITPPDSLKTDTTAPPKKYSKFKIEVDYASNNTFKGRRDTNNIPIISPYFRYTLKSKFYFKTSLVHAQNTTKAFDELDLGVGKKIKFNDKWGGSISYTHFFFDSKVTRIKAALQNDFSTYLTYDWDILYSQVTFDLCQGNDKFLFKGKRIQKKSRDVTLTLSNSHQFDIDNVFKSNDITITPEVDVLFGTQNFLATYKGKSDLNNKVYQNQVSTFNLTAYIFSLDVSYAIKNFCIDLMPSYTIPQNVPTGESSASYFIMSASIYYTIVGKK